MATADITIASISIVLALLVIIPMSFMSHKNERGLTGEVSHSGTIRNGVDVRKKSSILRYIVIATGVIELIFFYYIY